MDMLKEREDFLKKLDNFATFKWQGIDSKQYGMFIINEKNSLKFYNNSGFSNEYVKSHFHNNAQLLGVEFKKPQSINFKVGIYGFTIEEYQKILLWLDPLKINYLNFDFNKEYSYLVKLGSIQETSTRYILHKNDKDIYYYTELELKWELQGTSCVRSVLPYEFAIDSLQDGRKGYKWNFTNSETKGVSILSTPIVFAGEFNVSTDLTTVDQVDMYIEFGVKDQDGSFISLFIINFNPLTFNTLTSSTDARFDIVYDSETGLLFQKRGDDLILLNLVTEDSHGEYILKDMQVKKYMLPGIAEMADENYNKKEFQCIVYSSNPKVYIDLVKRNNTSIWIGKSSNILVYKRSNII